MTTKKTVDLFETIALGFENEESDRDLEKRLEALCGETVAVLVLDSTGFTRATRAYGIVYFLKCIARMRKAAGPLLEASSCISWRAEADNLYAEFEHPVQALGAAIRLSHEVEKLKMPIGEDRIYRVCVGIGYGPVLRDAREGVFGNQMNLASKMGEDLAQGGDILLSQAAYDALGSETGHHFEKHEIGISGVTMRYFELLTS